MLNRNLAFILITTVFLSTAVAQQDSLQKLGSVKFHGDLLGAKDISAISTTLDGLFLVIGSDEKTSVQVLKLKKHLEIL